MSLWFSVCLIKRLNSFRFSTPSSSEIPWLLLHLCTGNNIHINPLPFPFLRPDHAEASVSSSPAPGATAAASIGAPSQHAGVALFPVADCLAATEAAAFTLEEKGQHFEVFGLAGRRGDRPAANT